MKINFALVEKIEKNDNNNKKIDTQIWKARKKNSKKKDVINVKDENFIQTHIKYFKNI
jgi:hypothetical protein